MSMLASPVKRELIRTGKYGNRGAGAGGVDAPANHLGVDFRAAIGTPVYAPLAGTIVQITRGWRRGIGGRLEGSRIFAAYMAGNVVVVRGYLAGIGMVDVPLAHLDSVSASLQVGDTVDRGQWLGAAGNTGVVEAHVHLGAFRLTFINGRVVAWSPIDPTPLLPWDDDKFGELKIGLPAAKPAADASKADAPAPTVTITIQEDIMPMLIKIQGKDYFTNGRGYVLVKNEDDRKQLDAALQSWEWARRNNEWSFGLGKVNGRTLLEYLDALAKA